MKLRNIYEAPPIGGDAEGRWRVKVYQLNEQGKWDDRGTGHVSVDYIEQAETVGLVVIDEKDNGTLLLHRISPEDIYHRQEDTIISWTDQDASTDLALSFQESMGCASIWEQMCNAQRQIQFPAVGDDILHDGVGGDVPDLPVVELSNLPQIAKLVLEVSPFHRDRLAALIIRDSSFFRKLFDIFRTCQDVEDAEGLGFLFKIFKGIILLNESRIFDTIFNDEYIMDVVGALEYDPDLPARQDHRGFLKNSVVFKEAVPIRDPVTKSKIHQTYRIGYIKDVILPRVLDDQTFSTLNSMMLFNNVEVVMALQSDCQFLTELFSQLNSKDTSEPVWKDLVFFLQEFCNLGKHLQPIQRNQLFSSLISGGLFDIVTSALESSDESIRLSGTDILVASLNHDPGSLRSFLVEQPKNMLFTLLVKGMLTPTEGGLQVQLLEMMRMLLDSETMEESEKSTFLEVFYEKYIDKLVGALTAGCSVKNDSYGRSEPRVLSGSSAGGGIASGGNGAATGVQGEQTNYHVQNERSAGSSIISAEILNNICELLCFCVQHHSFRIKYYVLRNNVVEKVLRLTRRREKYLVVAAVRFLRTCVGLKDDFYYRHLVKYNLFEPIISAFLANGKVYNLLNSAVLELVEYIRSENIKSLVVHLVDTHWSKLQSVDYVETFKQLRIRYEQVKDEMANPPGMESCLITVGGRDHGIVRMGERMISALHARRIRDGSMDEDEEAYFNKDDSDDEEDVSGTVGSAAGMSARKSTRVGISSGDGGSGSWPQVIVNGTPLDAPLREGGIGLVDYDDEDEDVPSISASVHNGKEEGRVLIGPMPFQSTAGSPSSSESEVVSLDSSAEEPLGKRTSDSRDGPSQVVNPAKRRRKDGPWIWVGMGGRDTGRSELRDGEGRGDAAQESETRSRESGEVREDCHGAASENHSTASGDGRLGDDYDGGREVEKHPSMAERPERTEDTPDTSGDDSRREVELKDDGIWKDEGQGDVAPGVPDIVVESASPPGRPWEKTGVESEESLHRQSVADRSGDRGEELRGGDVDDARLVNWEEGSFERMGEGKGVVGNGLGNLVRTCESAEWGEREVVDVCLEAVANASSSHGSGDVNEINGSAAAHGALAGGCGGGSNAQGSGKSSSPGGNGMKGGIAGGGIGGGELAGMSGADVRRAETLLV